MHKYDKPQPLFYFFRILPRLQPKPLVLGRPYDTWSMYICLWGIWRDCRKQNAERLPHRSNNLAVYCPTFPPYNSFMPGSTRSKRAMFQRNSWSSRQMTKFKGPSFLQMKIPGLCYFAFNRLSSFLWYHLFSLNSISRSLFEGSDRLLFRPEQESQGLMRPNRSPYWNYKVLRIILRFSLHRPLQEFSQKKTNTQLPVAAL